MTSIILREIFSGFANLPSAWAVSERATPLAPEKDDGTGKDHAVVLPRGYKVVRTRGGVLWIYDRGGDWCALLADSTGRPQLVTLRGLVPLESAPSEDSEGRPYR